MLYMNCYNLLRNLRRFGSHGFHDAANGFLIIFRQAAVLMDQLRFRWVEAFTSGQRTIARKDVPRVHLVLYKSRHIPQIQRVRAKLVVFLSTSTHSQ